jgi:NADH-quinone oxidoreductase subunit L
VALAFVLAVRAFLQLLGLPPESALSSTALHLDPGRQPGVDVAFVIDPLSAVMILVVTGVGGLIHVYATGYMHDDRPTGASSPT